MGRVKEFVKKVVFNIYPMKFALALYQYKTMYFNKISFSQEGEDMVLTRLLNHKSKGFYIDVGAHHPILISNTYKFYLQGWTGINIDAMPGSMIPFKKLRPNDINLEYAISDEPQNMTYYMFNAPELNTFSKEEADYKNGKNGFESYHIIDKLEINTYTLKDILDANCPKDQLIDFMTIDVEGLDLAVLRSNDWSKYRPRFILVEALRDSFSFEKLNEAPVYSYLKGHNYSLVAKTYNTLFFKDDN